VDYCHINPVKQGFVQWAVDWPYSSFHSYVEQGIYPLDGLADQTSMFREAKEVDSQTFHVAQYASTLLRPTRAEMDTEIWKETFVEQKVNYMLEMDGKFILIENVPARVCLETGERLFSPETVERLQQMVWKQKEPSRRIEVSVFEFAA
jgi:YgiT-type zinc finger domain-containing protein